VATDVVQDLLRRGADIAVRMMRPTQNDVVARKVQTACRMVP
jgi:DNA-binding transcriptional LysR family regulator